MRTPWFALFAGGLVAGGWYLRRRGLARRAFEGTFHVAPADRMVAVGAPDPHSVRIWVRSDRPGRHVLELHDEERGTVATASFVVPADPALDGTTVVRWPEDTRHAPLRPGTRYRFVARGADGEPIGEGAFTTAPLGPHDAPDRFAVAVASCHQPFTDAGDLRPESLATLGVLERAFERHEVRQVLFLGDQMYTDLPAGHCLLEPRTFAQVAPPGRESLLDCTREEVRGILQQRYRVFWKPEPWRRIHARWPTICVLDDHEVIDNFGSDPAHATERYRALREGALDAFHDYQALRNHDRGRVRPSAFPTRFAWGPVAGLVLDLRSERRAEADRIRILGEGQWALLERFLAEEAERPVLLLGLSVPLVHVAEWIVEAGGAVAPEGSGAHDRWSHPLAVADRDRFVRILHGHRRRHPRQHVVLVSGDVHVGAVSEIVWTDAPPVLQLVSSAVSNLEKRVGRLLSAAALACRPDLATADGEIRGEARLLQGVGEDDQNPFTGLNAGIVEVIRGRNDWSVRLLLVSHDDADPPGPRVVFDSGPR